MPSSKALTPTADRGKNRDRKSAEKKKVLMEEVLLYVALTLALSLACAAATWFSYRAFVLYVNRFDKRYVKKKRSQRKIQSRHNTLAPVAHRRDAQTSGEADQADEFWPEIIDV